MVQYRQEEEIPLKIETQGGYDMNSRYEQVLENIGFTLKNETTMECRPTKIYEMKVGFTGRFEVALEDNGTARLLKPNGTYKWLVEKTPAQLGAICRQTLDFYR